MFGFNPVFLVLGEGQSPSLNEGLGVWGEGQALPIMKCMGFWGRRSPPSEIKYLMSVTFWFAINSENRIKSGRQQCGIMPNTCAIIFHNSNMIRIVFYTYCMENHAFQKEIRNKQTKLLNRNPGQILGLSAISTNQQVSDRDSATTSCAPKCGTNKKWFQTATS